MACMKTGGKRKQYKKKGGSGASGYGDYVWGKGGDQHAISADTNVIAVANDPAKYTGYNMKGGDLTTISVPAVLIATNQLYKPTKRVNEKRFRSKRSRKIRGGNLQTMIEQSNDIMKQSTDIMKSVTPTTMPAIVQNTGNSAPSLPNNVQVFGGTGTGELKQTGAGIITDIAVPAVLITANQLYSRKNRKNRSHRRSRRVAFKKYYKR
jgi:hypothetical protein